MNWSQKSPARGGHNLYGAFAIFSRPKRRRSTADEFCTEVILYKVQKFMSAGLTDTNLYCIKLSDLSLSAQLLASAAASINYLGVLKALVPFSVVSVTTLRLK